MQRVPEQEHPKERITQISIKEILQTRTTPRDGKQKKQNTCPETILQPTKRMEWENQKLMGPRRKITNEERQKMCKKKPLTKYLTILTTILGNKYPVPTIAEVQQQPEPLVARHMNKTTNKTKNRRERRKKSKANHNQSQDTTICYKWKQNQASCKFQEKCKLKHE